MALPTLPARRYPGGVDAGGYDPFEAGPQVVATTSFEAKDAARDRLFPCEVWHPQASGQHPLVVFSHYSGGSRTASSFLCWHLASHGYVVAAMDHSEVVAPELAARQGETSGERLARVNAIIASRVPDVRFLIDYLLGGYERAIYGVAIDETLIGLVGHSFGGWTALATPDVEPRVGAVAAFAPGGGSNPRPGILPLELAFGWDRDVPTLYLAAENDVSIPPGGVIELFERTPATKRMFMLRRADHQHFVDDVEASHEALRAMTLPGAAAWIPAAMLPISELCSGAQAHLFARGLTLSHLDAALRRSEAAERFLGSDVQPELAARAVDAVEYPGLEYPRLTEG
jgi:dienelactone hydrolase